jgi:hypothetical protein
MRISLRKPIDRSTPTVEVGVNRRGIGLVEVIVSMVVLAIAVTSLAGLTFSVSRQTIKVTGNAYRNGMLMHEVNRLIALPYDSVAIGTSSSGVSTGPYPHSRTIAVTEPVANFKRIQVVVIPTNPIFKPDTMNFTRTRARTSRVLCTVSCQW